MKLFLYTLWVLFLSLNSFSQDTIRFMDGTIIIDPKLDTLTDPFITNKTGHLEFRDLKNQLVVMDTSNSKPFVINIWATWCHPCVAEIPIFNKLLEKYVNCDVDFYALSYTEDIETTRKFIKSQPFNFKHILATHKYVEQNRLANGLPTTIFVDKNGNILYRISGGSTDPDKQEKTITEFTKGMEKIGCR